MFYSLSLDECAAAGRSEMSKKSKALTMTLITLPISSREVDSSDSWALWAPASSFPSSALKCAKESKLSYEMLA